MRVRISPCPFEEAHTAASVVGAGLKPAPTNVLRGSESWVFPVWPLHCAAEVGGLRRENTAVQTIDAWAVARHDPN